MPLSIRRPQNLPALAMLGMVMLLTFAARAEEPIDKTQAVEKAIAHLESNGASVQAIPPRFISPNSKTDPAPPTHYSVTLNKIEATDENIAALLVVPKVTYLYLNDGFKTEKKWWNAFSQFSELKQLYAGSDLKPGDLPSIAELSSLSVLEIGVSADVVEELSSLEKLTNLNLLSIGIAGDVKTPLQSLPKKLPDLLQLGLRFEGENDIKLDGIEKMTGLDYLMVSAKQIQGEELQAIAKLHQLQHLKVSGFTFSDGQLDAIGKMKDLKSLELSEITFSSNDLSALSSLQNLQLLQIRETEISDQSLATLSDVPQLEFVAIRDAAITDQGLKHLAKIPKLSEILLQDSEISAEGLEWFTSERPDVEIEAPIKKN